MKPTIALFFLSVLCTSVVGQIIPGATEDPAWVLPLYLSDANNNHDTIYVGYDPEALESPFIPDLQFGEQIITVPDNQFVAFTRNLPNGPIDSVNIAKAEIRPDFPGPSFQLGLLNAQLPIVISWDEAKFYSDSLPFEAQLVTPYGVGVLYTDLYGHDGGGGTEPIIMSDQPWPGNGIDYSDSVILNDFNCTDCTLDYIGLSFKVQNWESTGTGVLKESEPQVNVFPNPVYRTIHLTRLSNELADVAIINERGQLVAEITTKEFSNLIDCSQLVSGVYHLRISSENGIQNKKILKLKY